MTSRRSLMAVLALAMLVSLPGVSRGQGSDDLSEARDKYESASYEEALTILDSLDSNTRSGNEHEAIQHYRALCLIALDRLSDAEVPVEAMIRAKPLAPTDGDLPPRFRDLVARVRPRVARVMVKEYYARGRDLYQHHDFAGAREELRVAVALIDDTSLGLGTDPAYADIRLVADGFLRLATEGLASSAAAARADRGVALAPATGSDAGATSPAGPATTTAATTERVPTQAPGFSPPRAINQSVPPFPRWVASGPGREGEMQVDVDAGGAVRTAKLTRGVHPAYDPILVDAALKSWKYEPAVRNGVAVPYTIKVRIVLPPH